MILQQQYTGQFGMVHKAHLVRSRGLVRSTTQEFAMKIIKGIDTPPPPTPKVICVDLELQSWKSIQ